MTRPNVLMIVTDNQSADSLGCYGNVEHETPHIDRLAREGTTDVGPPFDPEETTT